MVISRLVVISIVLARILIYLQFFILCSVNNPNPECREAAYMDDDKFLTCRFDSSIEANITDCLGSPVSDALSTGARVEWCLLSEGETICLNSSLDESNVHGLPALNISNAGVLHIFSVTIAMKRLMSSNSNLVNCSFVNAQGQHCEPPILLNLFIFGGEGIICVIVWLCRRRGSVCKGSNEGRCNLTEHTPEKVII